MYSYIIIYIYDYKWWCIYDFSLNKLEGNIQRYLHSGKSTCVGKSHPNKESKMILNQTLKLRNSYQTYDGMPGANICFETIQLLFLSNSQLVISIHIFPSGRAQQKGNLWCSKNTTTVGSGSFQPNWKICSWIWIIPFKRSKKKEFKTHFAPPPHLMSSSCLWGFWCQIATKTNIYIGKSIIPDIEMLPPSGLQKADS